MASAAADAAKFRVLVVASDSDSEFADRLVRGLTSQHEFDASVAPRAGPGDDAANSRTVELIESADTIVFAISPDSIKERAWELDHAGNLSKRIVPVTCRALRRTRLPDELAEYGCVRFDSGRPFAIALRTLATSLRRNANWIRKHTKFLVRACAWENSARSEDLLLTGGEIAAAKMWTLERPKDAPKPSDLHMSFIRASEDAGVERHETDTQGDDEFAALEASAQLRTQRSAPSRLSPGPFIFAGSLLLVLGVGAGIWHAAKTVQRSEIALNQPAIQEPVDAQAEAPGAQEQVRATAVALAKPDPEPQAAKDPGLNHICQEAKELASSLDKADTKTALQGSVRAFSTLYAGPANALAELRGKDAATNEASDTAKSGNGSGPAQQRKLAELSRSIFHKQALSVADICNNLTTLD